MGMQREVNAMTIAPDPTPGSTAWPELHRQRRAIVVVDVVESVRLMQANEADVIDRWRRFVNEVRTQMLPTHGGRLVKSLGDGLLLEFESVPVAVESASEIRRRMAQHNTARACASAIHLRIGVHVADVVVDDLDVYGTGVNLAARLASLAGPDEIIVSPEVRDELVTGLDAEVEDLGECYVKHIEHAVHAYRVGPATADSGVENLPDQRLNDARPGIAVLPFECVFGDDPGDILGEALADDVISQLARSADMHVISGLSTRMLKRRQLGAADVGKRLGAAYVLSGRYRKHDGRAVLTAELAEARAGTVIWGDRFNTTLAAAFDPEEPLAARIVGELTRAILQQELQLALTLPLPTLESYTVLFGAITLMHRATRDEFDRSRLMLEYLSERQGRRGAAHAWLAKWHVLRVVQGWSPDPDQEASQAMSRTRRALDANPHNALALAIAGLVHGYLHKDLDTAGRLYEDALRAGPNEPLAWLFSATRNAYLGEGALAEAAADKALRLSPLDPMRYFFDSLGATAVLASSNWPRAVELAQRSIRANRSHASTWRTLIYALVMLERVDDARAAVGELLAIEPGFTVSRFRQRFPGRDGPMAAPWARALSMAGLPE
jgi:class 3 adenylate cyclase/TolB-like protein